MRLFVAVEIDPGVALHLSECCDELRRRAAVAAPHARITWVPSERLHVTVRFIGQVDDARARTISAAMEPALDVRPFAMTLQGVGAFPERGAPRVFWAGVATGAGSLAALAREVTARLEAHGIPREDRPYRAHVTLARVRDASGLRPGPVLDGLAGRPFGTSQVDATTLFESRPSPQGHVYVPLQRTSCGHRRSPGSDPGDG